MNRKQKRMWKRADRKFNRALKRGDLLSEKQKALIAVMEEANNELHRINEELRNKDEP